MKWLRSLVLWKYVYKLIGKALDLYGEMHADFKGERERFAQEELKEAVDEVNGKVTEAKYTVHDGE